jgi:hypothetical protein
LREVESNGSLLDEVASIVAELGFNLGGNTVVSGRRCIEFFCSEVEVV